MNAPTIQFQEIPFGGCFESRGRRYQKISLIVARDEDGNGSIFMAQSEVLPDPFAPSASTAPATNRPIPAQ
jgi:hypothetical protein